MPLIELDPILAFLNAEDKHHEVAVRYFSKVIEGRLPKPLISPFALQELELGVGAMKILPYGKPAQDEGSVASFLKEVCDAFSVWGFKVYPPSCSIFVKAAKLRVVHHLTYYDSLHASSAFFHDRESFQRTLTTTALRKLAERTLTSSEELRKRNVPLTS